MSALSSSIARASPIALAAVIAGCSCASTPPAPSPSPTPLPGPVTSVPPPLPSFPALGPITPPETTEDGIPILSVAAIGEEKKGEVATISEAWKTLDFAQIQATDGAGSFLAVRNDMQRFSDVLVRGGRLYVNVLAALSKSAPHPGGCGAAASGEILLSAPARLEHDYAIEQGLWRLHRDGRIESIPVPAEVGGERECKALLDPDGAYALFTFGLLFSDGRTSEIDRDWYKGRTEMGSARGPRYCFESCNGHEHTKDGDRAIASLKHALGDCFASYAVLGNWIAGRCRDGSRAARLSIGKDPEVLSGLPQAATLADGTFLGADGSLVIELALKMERYVVWRAGASSLGPIRAIASGEFLSSTSPPVLLRGLPRPIPDPTVSAVLLGESIAFGAGGSTYGYERLRGGEVARRAQVRRAEAVLPRGRLAVAHEAVVDLACGAYVRSPLGWEGEMIDDWTPPVLPELSKQAAFTPPACFALESVSALSGDPDLLLGRTPGGELAAAWLPPPLPLPKGRSHWDKVPPPPPGPQHPRPGSGWTTLGPVDTIDGESGAAPPGEDTKIADHTWQAAGGAVIAVGPARILLARKGAWTLPEGVTPMALETTTPRVYGARGSRLVVCDALCRTLDPGSGRTIVAVVPRTPDEVILGFDDDRTGVYTVPKGGGEAMPEHPLVPKLRALLRSKPREDTP